MADMDTYDNEPRTYDGMDYTDTYALYHGRRIRSYGDLVEYNNSSSDHWSRASEGEFNINPHYGSSLNAPPFLGEQLLTFKQSTRAAVTVPALALRALTAMATPVFATTLTVAAASGTYTRRPSELVLY